MVARAQFLHRLHYSVLLIDFQAHGESPGARITFGDRESRDVTAALNFLREELPAEHLGVIGVSQGAAAFVLAEDRPPVDAVILESMYPTIDQAVADRLKLHLGSWSGVLAPALLWQLKPRLGIDIERLRPIDRIGRIGAPLLLIHGTRDQHTDIGEARALFAAASPPKEWWAVEGAAHVDLHRFAVSSYEHRVDEFLSARLRHSNAISTAGSASATVDGVP
jgi:pimeloyl-ACP methyl ester carboxylesterase